MDKVVFSSCKPYLQICLSKGNKNSKFVTFGADSTYSPKDEIELQLLRGYAERYKSSYLIAENTDPTELKRKYEELEAEWIRKAEARELERLEDEKQRREAHEFSCLLRMADKAYR